MEISVTRIRKLSDGQPTPAEISDDISDEHVRLWRSTWVPFVTEAVSRFERQGKRRRDWPQDLHWRWDEKADWSRNIWALKRYALTSEGDLQGLLLLNLAKYSKLPSQKGRHVVYVEFVAAAPWNRPDMVEKRRFRGVGQALMRVAVEVSRHESFRGRVGLHSLPQACDFYRATCGMTDLGPDSSYDGLMYFEFTEEQADAFCRTPAK